LTIFDRTNCHYFIRPNWSLAAPSRSSVYTSFLDDQNGFDVIVEALTLKSHAKPQFL